MSIELNMYQGHMMTAKDDAVVYEPMLGGNGILYGCSISFLGANQVTISAGDGVIKGRKFTVLEETLNVQLPDEDGMPGRIYIHMDLSDSTEPIKILSTCSSAVLPELVQDENCNHNNGIYEIELATYTGNRSAIINLKTTYANVSAKMTEIQENINELKKSVADGKALVASALTQAGAETANNASFATLAANVANARPKQTVWTTSGVNMKDYFPSTWQKLRTNDFIAGTTSAGADGWFERGHGNGDSDAGGSASVSCSYNSSTGVLTFNVSTSQYNGSCCHITGKNYGTVFCAWRGTYSG